MSKLLNSTLPSFKPSLCLTSKLTAPFSHTVYLPITPGQTPLQRGCPGVKGATPPDGLVHSKLRIWKWNMLQRTYSRWLGIFQGTHLAGVTEWQSVETETFHKGRSVWTKLPSQSKKQKQKSKLENKTKPKKKNGGGEQLEKLPLSNNPWPKHLWGSLNTILTFLTVNIFKNDNFRQNYEVKMEQNNAVQICSMWAFKMNPLGIFKLWFFTHFCSQVFIAFNPRLPRTELP